MSTITVGSAPTDLGTSSTSHAPASGDPRAFAAELRSATQVDTTSDSPPSGFANSGATTSSAAPDPTAAPTPTPPAADNTPTPTAAPIGVGEPSAGQAPTAAQPVRAAVPPAGPDATTVGQAASESEPPAEPASGATTGDDAVLTPAPLLPGQSPSDESLPAQPLPTPPLSTTAPHHGSRHAVALDALPAPVSVTATASTPVAVAPGTSPIPEPLSATGTADEESAPSATAAVAAAAGAVPAAPGVTAIGSASAGSATTDDEAVQSTNTGKPSVSPIPATAVAPLPTIAVSAPVPASSAVANAQRPFVRVVASANSSASSFATALAQPTLSHAAAVDAPATPSGPEVAAPLNEQLAPPLFALRTAGSGTHVVTLTVSPESVGPVTVRAHVSGDTMRVELSAPTAQGTEALKSMLPDLKRDLAQGGMNSALTIASPNSDGSAAGNQNPFGSASGSFARDDRPSYARNGATEAAHATETSTTPLLRVGATSALDVLA